MKPHIALVEDNADNRLLAQVLLGDRYDVAAYEDGPAALAGIARTPPDLVLMDVSLPGMDGPALLLHLRAAPATARLPIVALTAHAMAGDREKYLALGFDEYLTKPILDERVLLDAVARALAARDERATC